MAEELTFSLRKRFPGGLELDCHETMRMEGARVAVLFGPSASGKTTLLRCLADSTGPMRAASPGAARSGSGRTCSCRRSGAASAMSPRRARCSRT